MSDEEIISTVIETGDTAIKEFEENSKNKGSIEKGGANLFILGFILVLLFGSFKLNNIFVNSQLKKTILKLRSDFNSFFVGNSVKLDKQTQKILAGIFGNDYRGIKATTNNQLERLKDELKKKKLSYKDLKKFMEERKKILDETTTNIVQQNSKAILSIDNGLKYVVCNTRKDDRVRPRHKLNDGKYWLAKDYAPWQDYGCRCSYTFYDKKNDVGKSTPLS